MFEATDLKSRQISKRKHSESKIMQERNKNETEEMFCMLGKGIRKGNS